MSVLKANQKPSPFEVEHHAYKIRTVITDLALRKFGLKEYAEKPKPETYSKWSQQQKDGYDKSVAKNKERYEAFIEWFIPDEQKSILNLCRNMIHEIFLANEIYPQHLCECDERRLHQDLAIGYCENLIQELQYVITTLHVNIEKYETITKMIVHEQNLIKGMIYQPHNSVLLGLLLHVYVLFCRFNYWLRGVRSATNFANVNNNGNANNNNASNSNGVRPISSACLTMLYADTGNEERRSCPCVCCIIRKKIKTMQFVTTDCYIRQI